MNGKKDLQQFLQEQFKMLELGIDVNKLIDEKEKELINDGLENELKLLFRKCEL